MTNVIRPTFGARTRPDDVPSKSRPADEHTALRIFGRAAGYTVALIQDESEQQGSVLKVVVGPSEGREVEAVAILPATPEGDADAEVVGLAILRTLEIIETVPGGSKPA